MSRVESSDFVSYLPSRAQSTPRSPANLDHEESPPRVAHRTDMASSHLALHVLTAQELRSDTLLVSTCVLINESYRDRESEGLLDRYPSPEEFARDLDADGLCAVIQDGQHENLPVAVV